MNVYRAAQQKKKILMPFPPPWHESEQGWAPQLQLNSTEAMDTQQLLNQMPQTELWKINSVQRHSVTSSKNPRILER